MKCKQLIKNNYENIILFVIMGCLAFCFLINSPLHPWVNGEAGTDSSVFKTIALLMEDGLMPYRDSFDHKGPLLYILNWIGNNISYYKGIWLIEFLFMTATFFIVYKIARLSCNIRNSFVVMLVSCSLLFYYFEGGNLVEEYAMPFIAAAIYIFIDYLKNNRVSRKRILISGVALGATSLLRPNMIAIWCVFCIMIFGMSVIKHDWEQLRTFVIWFLTGVLLILLPFFVWLTINNTLEYFWNQYIIFNSAYASAEFIARLRTFLHFFNTTVFMLSFFSILYSCIIKRELLNVTYVVYMIVNLAFIGMSGIGYGHYGMILVPAVAYPLSLIFEELEKEEIKGVSKAVSMFVWVYMMSVLVMPDSGFIKNANINGQNRSNQTAKVVDIIQNYTSEEDTISVYGNWNIVYVLSKRKPATKYSYQFPIGQVMPEIMEEHMEQLQENLPPIVVVQGGRFDSNISEFLQMNNYNMIWEEEGTSSGGALIYLL